MSTAFTATIQLYPGNAGGRTEPLLGGEWKVLLAFTGGKSPARLTFKGQPAPGEKFLANVDLLDANPAVCLQAGTQFIVWDNGTKAMGIIATLVADD